MNGGAIHEVAERFKSAPMEEEPPVYDTGESPIQPISKVSPQKENGYTGLANELYDEILKAPLSARQMRVFLAIIRKTYGYHKTADRISISQIAKATGIKPAHVSEARQQLLSMNMLVQAGSSHSEIGPNKHYDMWDFRPKKTVSSSKIITHGGNFQKSVNSAELLPTGVTKLLPTGVNTKENKESKELTKVNSSSPDGDDASTAPKKSKRKKPEFPNCPHEEILKAWQKHFPQKSQPTTWKGTRKTNLATRWREGFTTKVRFGSRAGQNFYTDLESGISWWDRFFDYCSKRPFLRNSRFFQINWVILPTNFEKVIDGNYEDEQ